MDNRNTFFNPIQTKKVAPEQPFIQNIRISYLKKHHEEQMGINTAFSEQVKTAITTAKTADSRRGWQGIKAIVLGATAGLAVGLLVGISVQ